MVLRITELLRAHGVVGKFVEFYGPGVKNLALADRATIANMAPEYGATMGFFPVDDETLRYLRATGRPDELLDLVERYTKANHLFREDDSPDPEFSSTLGLDLADVKPALAGPKRPQDRIDLTHVPEAFRGDMQKPKTARGFGVEEGDLQNEATLARDGMRFALKHGSVVIAAITSCTNTSNPYVMMAAGLLASRRHVW